MEIIWIVLGISVFISPLFIALTTMTKDLRDGENNTEKIPVPRDPRPTPEDGLICSMSSTFVGLEPPLDPHFGDMYFDENDGSLFMYDGNNFLTISLADPVWPTYTPTIKVTKCPECGAPRAMHREVCPYCGVPYPLE